MFTQATATLDYLHCLFNQSLCWIHKVTSFACCGSYSIRYKTVLLKFITLPCVIFLSISSASSDCSLSTKASIKKQYHCLLRYGRNCSSSSKAASHLASFALISSTSSLLITSFFKRYGVTSSEFSLLYMCLAAFDIAWRCFLLFGTRRPRRISATFG